MEVPEKPCHFYYIPRLINMAFFFLLLFFLSKRAVYDPLLSRLIVELHRIPVLMHTTNLKQDVLAVRCPGNSVFGSQNWFTCGSLYANSSFVITRERSMARGPQISGRP